MTLDFPEHAGAAGPVWDRIAAWWDDRIGDGNDTQDLLVEPTQERLLDLKPGETVLDIACGAGRFARRMAAGGARVVAFDRCEPFLERARRRGAEGIEYRCIDATEGAALLALGRARFDAAVCTMAIMDIACLSPLLSALPELLRPGGRFVFSIPHPSFNSGDARLTAAEDARGGRGAPRLSVSVADYLSPRATLEEGIRGQPEPHMVFHRPLGALLNALFDRGFVVDRIEEPAMPERPESGKGPLAWARFTRIPQVLVARLRSLAPPP